MESYNEEYRPTKDVESKNTCMTKIQAYMDIMETIKVKRLN